MKEPGFIIVVEDDADDRFLFQTAFEENGFKDSLLYLENGYELIQYLKQLKPGNSGEKIPGFILMDLNMPKLNGREVLREIKKDDTWNSVPVVIFSTTSNEAERLRCMELGAAAYYTKPVTFGALISTVAQIRNSFA